MADPFNIRGFGPVPNYPESAPSAPQSANHPQPSTSVPSQASLNQFGPLGAMRRPKTPRPERITPTMVSPDSLDRLSAAADNDAKRVLIYAVNHAINNELFERFPDTIQTPGRAQYGADLQVANRSATVLAEFMPLEGGRFALTHASISKPKLPESL
ncbi:hypothetical protein G3O00_43175, partial [Burkholderia sp. Ac-20384]|uniref:hypothetical protein n=1 Tax=Burkholderia sp. Ac-20384 TaxID=2703902 RepID=UPI0019808FC1